MNLERALWRAVFSFGDFAARQLGHPSGPGGWLLLPMMNRANREMNARTVDSLELSQGDSVLEVGFGGGDLLAQLSASGLPARLAGVDRSRAALAHCRRRFSGLVTSGTVDLRAGSVDALPFPDGAFTRLCAVNAVYFWRDLDRALSECRRVLGPAGRIALTCNTAAFLERQGLTKRGVVARSEVEIEDALGRAGFTAVLTTRSRDTANRRFFCSAGTVPGPAQARDEVPRQVPRGPSAESRLS